jgi:hypothetical protein
MEAWILLGLLGGVASNLGAFIRALVPELERNARLKRASRYLPHLLGGGLAHLAPALTPATTPESAWVYGALAVLFWGPAYDLLKTRFKPKQEEGSEP